MPDEHELITSEERDELERQLHMRVVELDEERIKRVTPMAPGVHKRRTGR